MRSIYCIILLSFYFYFIFNKKNFDCSTQGFHIHIEHIPNNITSLVFFNICWRARQKKWIIKYNNDLTEKKKFTNNMCALTFFPTDTTKTCTPSSSSLPAIFLFIIISSTGRSRWKKNYEHDGSFSTITIWLCQFIHVDEKLHLKKKKKLILDRKIEIRWMT